MGRGDGGEGQRGVMDVNTRRIVRVTEACYELDDVDDCPNTTGQRSVHRRTKGIADDTRQDWRDDGSPVRFAGGVAFVENHALIDLTAAEHTAACRYLGAFLRLLAEALGHPRRPTPFFSHGCPGCHVRRKAIFCRVCAEEAAAGAMS